MNSATFSRVFIVDDSPAIRSNLGEMIRRLSNATVDGEAASAQDAIDGILASIPDVVILDLHLAGGSGLAVLRTLHPKLPSVVFAVLTNNPTPQYRRLCMDAGASHFFDKSNEFVRVIDLVRCGLAHCPNDANTQTQVREAFNASR